MPVAGGLEIDVDRQDLQDLDEAVVLCDGHTANDVLDGEPRLDAVPVGPLTGAPILDPAAEKQFF